MILSAYFLAESLGARLLSENLTVTTAESCTAGGLSHAITDVPGSSQWFEAGFVTYSNKMKEQVLGVDAGLIAQHGAVSEPVVHAMLEGAMWVSQADIGAAISGVAGPGGGSESKPVGTICFAVGSRDNISTFTETFEGDRQGIREQTVICALERLLESLN